MMNVWQAIQEMRRISAEGGSFSFSFMSYDEERGRSEGVVEVRHARLRKREKKEYHRHAEHVEAYTDLDTGQPRRFWQPLLMTFNREKTILI